MKEPLCRVCTGGLTRSGPPVVARVVRTVDGVAGVTTHPSVPPRRDPVVSESGPGGSTRRTGGERRSRRSRSTTL